ncbi:hypothetical protein [Rhodococcus sp. 14-1411-2a]|uniref:hypothetical protein n=1 Tax=Rhodococcus sp. 14-1411-2a TaxID=2023151 RepID=UPI0015C5D2C4|nr:hypothetical protein [Rhodococcus sp. 14-1411-2a]
MDDFHQLPLGRNMTDTDITQVTMLSMNTNQSYFNELLAAQNPITGGCVICN